jgi:glycosyltransferase involved in cell wall biosynthesis
MWHPPEGGATGGFLRAKRVLEGMPGFDLTVVDTDTTDITMTPPQGRIVRIPARRIRSARYHAAGRVANWLWSGANLLLAGLRAGPIDAVYIPNGDILVTSIPGLLVALARRVPVIACTFEGPGVVFWSINRHVHRRFAAIITLSHASRERMVADRLHVPIQLGLMGVDQPPPAVMAEPTQASWDAVYIARHFPEKGVFDVIEIWAQVVARRPRARLAMAGSVSSPMRLELEQRIEAAGLRASIALLGPVDNATKWRLYRDARVCLFPSRAEGWGVVPVEAHAAGIPVVAYDLPAYTENIARSNGAVLCRIGDTGACARAVLAYLDGAPVDREPLQQFSRQFSWSAAVEREAQLLSAAISSPHSQEQHQR